MQHVIGSYMEKKFPLKTSNKRLQFNIERIIQNWMILKIIFSHQLNFSFIPTNSITFKYKSNGKASTFFKHNFLIDP